MKDLYDVVIIGSGLGGLVCANILAKENLRVCILEKNQQFGGNLQTFSRDKVIFDTGVHYIGGLDKDQNLYKYFKYLEIIDELNLRKLDEDGFDIISFDNDEKEYKHAQGYKNFSNTLLQDFPNEKKAINEYCKILKKYCAKFPLYNVEEGSPPYLENPELLTTGAKDLIRSLTKNKKLQAVLSGTNLLYAGDKDRTPFYVHALTVNSFIESSYRVVNGGSQISKLLVRKLKSKGGDAFKRHEVIKFKFKDKKVYSVICSNGKEIKGKLFISNVDPKLTLNLLNTNLLRKSYVKRVKNIESVIGGFSLYIVLKPNTFEYQNRNYYHTKDYNDIWNIQDYSEKTWPKGYMMSMSVKNNNSKWGETLTVMTYMKYSDVKEWESTFNAAINRNDRGSSYEKFKKTKTEKLINEIEKKIPNIRNCIKKVYTSTPLSYRDYIGCNKGGIYGYVKDINTPLRSFISPKTKVKNLFFTGQCLNMHGILGVTVGGVLTCSEILGQKYLLNKIRN